MRARTRKQGLALAFGKYRYGVARRREATQIETERQRRRATVEARGNIICWKCDAERADTAKTCEHCGALPTPF